MISYTLQIVALGAGFIGFVSGLLSVFFVNRKQSILGDAISHASLAGITLSFIILQEKVKFFIVLGALLSALGAMGLIYVIDRYTKVKSDAAIAIVLSLFFGFGIVLLSLIQRLEISSQSGLRHYLFGNIAFLRFSDLPLLVSLGLIIITLIILNWKELKLITFDIEYAKIIGLPVFRYELLIIIMGISIIVIGVDLIGVVMMAGLLVAPAMAARQWVSTYNTLMILSAIFGMFGGVLGTILSANFSNLPPGPTIIVLLALLVIISIIFSSKGLISYYFRYAYYTSRYNVEEKIFHLADHMRLNPTFCDIREFDIDPDHDSVIVHPHSSKFKENHTLYDDLDILIHLGYILPREGGTWILTYKGMETVNKINQEAS